MIDLLQLWQIDWSDNMGLKLQLDMADTILGNFSLISVLINAIGNSRLSMAKKIVMEKSYTIHNCFRTP